MKYLFDTSAVNRLLDDPSRQPLLDGLTSTNTIWVSILNVVEAGRTPHDGRRVSLLRLLKRMTGATRPLEAPPFLLQRGIKAYARRDRNRTVTIEKEHDDAWAALNEPERLAPKDRQFLDQRHADVERRFLDCLRAGRPDFQALFAQGTDRPRAAQLLKAYAADMDFLYEAIGPLYERITSRTLPREGVSELLTAIPELAAFLAGWGYAVWRRSVAANRYGANNAGAFDLWFATYLPFVDRFVTADAKQYRALRLVARLTAPRCTVLKYDVFTSHLLL